MPVTNRSALLDVLHSKYCVTPSNISGIRKKAMYHPGDQINHKIIAQIYPAIIPVHLAQTGN